MRRAPALCLALAALALGGCTLVNPGPPAAERGRRLAEREGCFACHGPEGIRGTANPGRKDKSVPTYAGDVMMFADNDAELREWIRDGVPKSRRKSQSWQQESRRGTLRMPAFGRRLSAHQIDDLVAFIDASSGRPEPADSAAIAGLARARALGCTGCHGAGGRLARPNPGSLRGFIPPWDGPDFPELVRDRGEFDEWVTKGISRRFDANRLAKFFLRRAPVHMPGFEAHLDSTDTGKLWSYVQWLRGTPH
jgi:mono/diheme cytochrome c family protein